MLNSHLFIGQFLKLQTYFFQLFIENEAAYLDGRILRKRINFAVPEIIFSVVDHYWYAFFAGYQVLES